jgi:D-isomer specific 2-hydroxyacid dehydrogenase, NAD binding domain
VSPCRSHCYRSNRTSRVSRSQEFERLSNELLVARRRAINPCHVERAHSGPRRCGGVAVDEADRNLGEHFARAGPDEDALVDTLREKRISTAAIDVYDIEPLPADHPLRTLPNALLTGHIADVTDDLYRTFYQDSVEDIAAFQTGAPVRLMA